MTLEGNTYIRDDDREYLLWSTFKNSASHFEISSVRFFLSAWISVGSSSLWCSAHFKINGKMFELTSGNGRKFSSSSEISQSSNKCLMVPEHLAISKVVSKISPSDVYNLTDSYRNKKSSIIKYCFDVIVAEEIFHENSDQSFFVLQNISNFTYNSTSINQC